MKMLLRFALYISCSMLTVPCFSWNAAGHKLVAQIAYNHLDMDARNNADSLNRALNAVYPSPNFVAASTWLDTIRHQDVKWYDRMHYVNWPFSRDGTALPMIESVNAVWAMENALETLASKWAKPFDKGLALRILIHVTGDIHQPLHATTLASLQHPKGDLGGNLYPIQGGKLGKNLHAWWDKGGGLLSGDSSKAAIQKKAEAISEHWPCDNIQILTPEQWLEESHILGVGKAYALAAGAVPDAHYQAETQMISEQRIAQAGCRLAALLNNPYYQKRGKH